jgi:hypothetical protein
MLALAAAHAAVLLIVPSASVVALGLWWNANTISHNFIHRPFFRRRAANRLFAAYLSVLLGFPHSLWHDRHLIHHGLLRSRRGHFSGELALQASLVLSLWVAIGTYAPRFFLTVYLPGYTAGLVLCALHGYYEHAHGTTSHYGTLYNLMFFNDGYHVEHHANPQLHWRLLPESTKPAARASAWPAPLRWLDVFSLASLERLTLRSPALQRFVLRTHTRAFHKLVGVLPPVCRLAIVGGGLFPRTAIVLQKLLPEARVTIIDADASHLNRARSLLGGSRVEFVQARYPEADITSYDLVVFPLSFEGKRDDIYARPPAPAVIVHDWIWHKRGVSRVVSLLLLKRVNLIGL